MHTLFSRFLAGFMLTSGLLGPHVFAQSRTQYERPDVGATPGSRATAWEYVPFASSAAIEANVSPAERARLHPFFQSVLAAHRSGSDPMPLGDHVIEGAVVSGGQPTFGAVLYSDDVAAVRAAGIEVNVERDRFATIRFSPAELEVLAGLDAVHYVDPGPISYPDMDISFYATGAHLLHEGLLNDTPYTGEGAMIVIFDTGIDWTHPDFRDPLDQSKSRIKYLWDVTLAPQIGETPPIQGCCLYGVEYSRQEIEAALAGTGTVRSEDTNGHGTHVAGTSSGLGSRFKGIAPDADLIVIRGGVHSFSQSNIINGLQYAADKSQLHGKPVVVNMSLGSQQGAHDGTRPDEIQVDNLSRNPGFVFVNSAGNSGGDPLHVSGTILPGGVEQIRFTVPQYTPGESANDDFFRIDVWFDSNADVTAAVTSPNGASNSTWQHGSSFTEHTEDGSITVQNRIDFTNGHRNVDWRVFDGDAEFPPASGTWTLEIRNDESGAISYHGWRTARSPSLGAAYVVGGDTDYTISMPGTAEEAVVVGSYVTRWSWSTNAGSSFIYSNDFNLWQNISAFSSKGPTRDGRLKPDIAAPGQGIFSATSSHAGSQHESRIAPGGLHHLSQGTSMAAPHITGVIALMLGAKPELTARDVRENLAAGALSDSFTGTLPDATWGHGKASAVRSLAKALNPASNPLYEMIGHDAAGSSAVVTIGSARKLAVGFTPSFTGRLTGATVGIGTPASTSISGDGPAIVEVLADDNGQPGPRIGEPLMIPFSDLEFNSLNYVSLYSLNIIVAEGTTYYVSVTVQNEGDEIKPTLDDGSAGNVATFIYRGDFSNEADHGWYSYGAPGSGISTVRNARIRVEIANDDVQQVAISEDKPGAILDGQAYHLSPAYPNPFNPQTSFTLTVAQAQHVKIELFNLLGQRVATLHDGPLQADHAHAFSFNGQGLPSGLYFYRAAGDYFNATKSIVLSK